MPQSRLPAEPLTSRIANPARNSQRQPDARQIAAEMTSTTTFVSIVAVGGNACALT